VHLSRSNSSVFDGKSINPFIRSKVVFILENTGISGQIFPGIGPTRACDIRACLIPDDSYSLNPRLG
jgi:hypothetical protein